MKGVDCSDVLAHLTLNVADFYTNQNQRDLIVDLAASLAGKLETLRPEDASSARVCSAIWSGIRG